MGAKNISFDFTGQVVIVTGAGKGIGRRTALAFAAAGASVALAGRAMLAKRHGSIVNIGSIGGASALVASHPGYAATKAALSGLTVALAGEWAPHGVRVNTVAPGYIATEMNQKTRQDPAFVDAVQRRTPMGRFGTPEEVACAVTFLASNRAAYITGQTLFVDGGWTSL